LHAEFREFAQHARLQAFELRTPRQHPIGESFSMRQLKPVEERRAV